MQTQSRRQYLACVSAATALPLAGCLTDGEEPEFLVTDAVFSIQDSGDMEVQITVENGALERQQKTLEVIVRYEPEDGETQEWRQTEELELSGGTEILRHFRFEDVHEPGAEPEDYTIDAQLIDDDELTPGDEESTDENGESNERIQS